MTNFFISYNKEDRTWAEWIAWQLEEKGYTTVLQAWDFGPGSNFVLEMDRAVGESERTIAVLSPDYVSSLYTQPEWAATFAADPTGARRKLITVLVRKCELRGLLAQIVYIKLVGLDEESARQALLAGVAVGRGKPAATPTFPGTREQPAPASTPTPFPGPARALPPAELTPGQQQRLQQLREHVRKDQELLNEYENALRYEDEPKRKAKYRQEIEDLNRSIRQRIEEYDRLGVDVENGHSNLLDEVGTDLRQMDAKLDSLLAGQDTLRQDVLELRTTIVLRFDATEARIVTAVVSQLEESQVESVERVLRALETRHIGEQEMRSTLAALQDALTTLQDWPALPDRGVAEEVEQAAQIIKDPNVDIVHRLKVAIPIIPLVLSYETAIELKSGPNLRAIWQRLTHRSSSEP